MPIESNLPWYKQFWPWFLIFIPVLSICLSFSMLYLATSDPDDLVKDNYYKEGKSINADLAKQRFAKALGLETQLLIKDGQVALKFETAPSQLGSALYMHFYHATMAEKDFDLTLLRDAKGVYRASLPTDVSAKWTLSLEPIDEEWEMRKSFTLPRNDWFLFVAE